MMKRILLLVLLFASVGIKAQTLEDFNAEIVKFVNKGEYDKAITVAINSAEFAYINFGKESNNYAAVLNNLGYLYEHTDDFKKAETFYLQSVSIRKKILPFNHPDYFVSLQNLANLYIKSRQYSKAEVFSLQIAEQIKKKPGITSPEYAEALNRLALAYDGQKKYDQAEQHYLQSLHILRTTNSTDLFLSFLNNLAIHYNNRNNILKAESVYLELIANRKKILGEEHVEYIEAIFDLAALYSRAEKYVKAEPLLIQTIAFQKKTVGEENAGYITNLENLATIYKKTAQYKKSDSLWEQITWFNLKKFGDSSSEYASALNERGLLYSAENNYDKAEKTYGEALTILRTKQGSDKLLMNVLNNIAAVYKAKKNFTKNEDILLELIALHKKLSGDRDPAYITSLNELSLFYADNGEYARALQLSILVHQIQKQQQLTESPDYAVGLTNLGILYGKIGEKKKAEPFFVEALALIKKTAGINSPAYANNLMNLGVLYGSTGQYKKAEPLLLQAVDLQKKTGPLSSQYANSLKILGALYQKMNLYSKAEILLLQAQSIIKKSPGQAHGDYALILSKLASLYNELNQFTKSEQLYIKAVEISKKAFGEQKAEYAIILSDLGSLYVEMSEYDKAELLLVQALDILKKELGSEHPDYANRLNNLALLFQETGQYTKAELFFLQALRITKKVSGEESSDYTVNLSNLAYLYKTIGQYPKAEQFYLQVLEIDKKQRGTENKSYAIALNNLADLYSNTKEFNKAENLYIESLAIFKKILGKNHAMFANILSNLGTVYVKTKKFKKAEPLLVEALAIRKKVLGDTHPDYAITLNNLAEVYINVGLLEKAESFHLQSNSIWKKRFGPEHPSYASSVSNLALLYQYMDKYEQAEVLLTAYKNIEINNLLKVFTVLSEKEKGNYLGNNLALNNSNNSFLYLYPKAGSSFYQSNFNLQLFLKSLSLSDTKNALDALRNSSDTTTQNLFIRWKTAKAGLAMQYSLPLESRRKDLKLVEAETEKVEKELNRFSSGFQKQQQILQIKLTDVQKNLEKDEIAIEFVSFRLFNKKWTDSTVYAAYILNKYDSVPVFVPLCEEKQLQKLFDSAGRTATDMVSKFYRGLEIKNKNVSSLGKELYKLVWYPLEPYLKGVKKISYSPAGKLYSIAFQALPVDSTTILMDKYELQQYTSTRQVALRNSENTTTKPKNITLFGNASFTMDSLQLVKQKADKKEKENVSTSIYTLQKRSSDNNTWNNLPGTADEVNKIKHLFDSNQINTKSFIQTAASEENLKALNGNSPQILHIATHGFFLPEPDKKKKENGFDQGNTYTLADDPLLRSGLILAGGNYAWSGKTPIDGVEDGIATAYEISQLNLSNTELVVLSACETALGDIKGSEGVFGLQRAFKMAGVKKMIVSLWQVPDKETAELMTAFYSCWINGKTINESFSQAQADMRKKYSPFYWAAFVLVE